MNQHLHSSYTEHQRTFETTREGEARALLSCAAKLEDVRADDISREDVGTAIRHNQKLWSLFQVSLCEPSNPLPKELKGTLLNLSRYIDKVSFRILAGSEKELIRSLISINRTIAKGLNVNNEAQKEGQTPSSPQGKPPQSITTSA
ncbi:MAG TPA: flagellar biosynthesis regulatory protein FlaF [Rhodospirillaceae bacterium]|nr:flagellar biosynthesis regulatory protein FlaF [Rhodospirillaceae bacterium]